MLFGHCHYASWKAVAPMHGQANSVPRWQVVQKLLQVSDTLSGDIEVDASFYAEIPKTSYHFAEVVSSIFILYHANNFDCFVVGTDTSPIVTTNSCLCVCISVRPSGGVSTSLRYA